MKVYDSPLAGRWYPSDGATLRHELEALRPRPAAPLDPEVCAVVVPHAGYAYSGSTAAAVYARLDAARYDRVLILAPSHTVALGGRISLARVSGYRTPLGVSPADREWIERCLQLDGVSEVPAAHRDEHADQIQVPLIQHFLGLELPLACAVMGPFDAPARTVLARQLRALLDERTLVVASTDFTHYGRRFGYVPFVEPSTARLATRIEALDREVFEAFAAQDDAAFTEVLERTGATVCGRETLALLLRLRPAGMAVERVAYAQSGALTGDWSNCVSYLGALVRGSWTRAGCDGTVEPGIRQGASGEDGAFSPEDRSRLLALARAALEHAVAQGRPLPRAHCQSYRSPALERIAGGFVTLRTPAGRLRGCIGEIEATRPLWDVVREQACNAALNDPRFPPVTPAEAVRLRIEVSALTPPRPVASWSAIEVGRHGVFLRKQGRQAVFLPQVALEEGWDRETLLTHLALKAGLPADAWRRDAAFEVFEAQLAQEPPTGTSVSDGTFR